jgi:serine/threonine protein kinase
MVGAMGSQIELLSVVHHKYLVSLLGYRCTRKQQVLVYEYLSGGDLRQRLQGAILSRSLVKFCIRVPDRYN